MLQVLLNAAFYAGYSLLICCYKCSTCCCIWFSAVNTGCFRELQLCCWTWQAVQVFIGWDCRQGHLRRKWNTHTWYSIYMRILDIFWPFFSLWLLCNIIVMKFSWLVTVIVSNVLYFHDLTRNLHSKKIAPSLSSTKAYSL